MSQPYRIGITGGIATGKSTVTAYLATAHQLPILDADVYAREAVAKDSPILTALANQFGSHILHPDGHLNRSQLGEIIFNDPQARDWVEKQIHPFVRQRFQETLSRLKHKIAILAIPLLFEAQFTDLVEQIWVISCSRQEQINRLCHRNQLTPEQASARIDSQFPLDQKEQQADVVIKNNADLDNLYQQVDKYLSSVMSNQQLKINP
ncbi:dephospho-CoA kinase [Spirulina sp. CS-785/01]|uniref:dephospho-CoA kinase n=1 Tax=Spirulina sp. CS-785/01 TaxID=3021716 RepID=UPI00232DB5C1|nr:dephospho-CoA kinase [Spirulina sp. CS-785/01]MDB9314290.1 dephospho-CoA kinase [Spirulina sp. CS-785/01]